MESKKEVNPATMEISQMEMDVLLNVRLKVTSPVQAARKASVYPMDLIVEMETSTEVINATMEIQTTEMDVLRCAALKPTMPAVENLALVFTLNKNTASVITPEALPILIIQFPSAEVRFVLTKLSMVIQRVLVMEILYRIVRETLHCPAHLSVQGRPILPVEMA